jgi:hypothetical protein
MKGAHSIEKALHRSVGIRVELPFEQEVNPFVGQAYEHRTFFSRLHHRRWRVWKDGRFHWHAGRRDQNQ